MKEIEKYVGYYLGVYIVVLAICGFFQYFYHCQGESLMCAISIDGIGTIITTTATLLTPIVAIIGFLNWKIEKQYDLEKSHAENLIRRLNSIQLTIDLKYHLLKQLENIQEKFISINNIGDKLNLSNELNSLKIEFQNLNRILDTKIDDDKIQEFILNTELFKLAIDSIEDLYQKYYDLLNPDLKRSEDTNIQEINFHKYPINQNMTPAAFRVEIVNNLYNLITSQNITIDIRDNLTKELKVWEKSYSSYKSSYDTCFNKLIADLVKIIKPHKKTAS